MPTVSSLFPRRFLRADDLAGKGQAIVTIRGWTAEQLRTPAGKMVDRFAVWFSGKDMGLVLCAETARAIADALGTEELDDWSGGKIILFHDPQVRTSNGNGAIRVRAVTS